MKTLLTIFCFCLSSLAFPQSPHFRKHALPLDFKNAQIRCMQKGRDHFIWLGTSKGLVRFDGTNYKYFPQFPSENNVIALFEDSKGILWIGYENGKVGKFSNDKFISAITKATTSITGFAEDKHGRIWIATYGEGIVSLGKTDTLRVNTANGLADDFIYSIAADPQGNIYTGTDEGISICSITDSKVFVKTITTTNGLRDNLITYLTTDKKGIVWAGTDSQGICRVDPVTLSVNCSSTQWQFGRITSILPLEGTCWVGTSMNGLIEVRMSDGNSHKLEIIGQNISPVTDLLQDYEGNIWVSNNTSAVMSGNRMFTFLSPFEKNSTTPVQAMTFAREGKLWFSTSDGVNFLDPFRQQRSQRLDIKALKKVQVISLYEDSRGIIWCGTFDNGAIGYDPSTHATYHLTEKDGLTNNNVLSIAGNDHELWFATLGGVSRCKFNPETRKASFENFNSESGLGSNYIYKVFIDSRGRVWFATDGKGVTMLDKGTFTNYSLRQGLKSDIVYSITEDATRKIWVSTANAGIFRFDGTSFKSFTPHNGLRDLSIASVVGDKNGNVLIVSRQGIDVLDPGSGAVFYHGDEFGIGSMDPNLNVYALDNSGNIWFGTDTKIICYNMNIPQMKKWPVTMINEVQVFLSRIDTVKKKFSYDENHISFDYMGFWYHDPAEVSYKVKLEGYDREWVSSKNHSVTYPSLPPGNYTFKVQSSATSHFEGAQTASYSFAIAPPFYQTSIFYGASFLIAVGLIYGFVKRRERKLQAQERIEKEKIQFKFETLKNQVNPHFLFNSFNTLIGVIEQDPDTAVEYVERLSDFYRDILDVREKDVIPLRKEIDMIGNYYFLQKKRYHANLSMTIDIAAPVKEWSIAPLTLQLLVENAIKHNIISSEKPLTVEIFTERDYVAVRNNLQAKIVPEASTGVGLNNIINRLGLLTDKEVKIERTTSHFTVRVPLIKE